MGQLRLAAVGPPARLGEGGPSVGDAAAPDLPGALVDPPFAIFEGLEREGRLRDDHAFQSAQGV